MAPPRSSDSRQGAPAGFEGRAPAGSRQAAPAAAATAGLLTRAARGVAARALGLLQDDSILLSSSVHITLLYYALCWEDGGRAVLSILLMKPGGRWSSDGLQERVGLLMLLRWAASFLLPTSSPWVTGAAAAAAAHTIAISSRGAMAAACACGASERRKVLAILLIQLLQLAYWLPVARALWTIAAALWGSAWSGAPLLQRPLLQAVAFIALCCERWRLHCELLFASSLKGRTSEECQPLLLASRQLGHELGRWPLHLVATVIHGLSPQAAPHVAMRYNTALLRTYARAGAFLAPDRTSWYLLSPTPPYTVAGTVLGYYVVACFSIVVACIVYGVRAGFIFGSVLVGMHDHLEDWSFVPSCRVLYPPGESPGHDFISRAVSTAAAAAAAPVRASLLGVCSRALAMVTWLDRQLAWRQALHFYVLALANLSAGKPFTSAQQLWQPELAVAGCLLGAAAQFKQLPTFLDIPSLQVAFGGLPITCFLVSCLLGSGRLSWWVGLSLTGRIVEHGRQLSATPTCTQLVARLVFSLLFWFSAARSAYLTAAAALAAGGLRHVPAALLLNPAVLPHALLLAFSGVLWTQQAVLDSLDAEGRPEEAAAVQAAAPLDDASWAPLAACRTVLQLALILLSGQPSSAVAGEGPYPLPLAFRMLLAVEEAAAHRTSGQQDATFGSMMRAAQSGFRYHCNAVFVEPALLMLMGVAHLCQAMRSSVLPLVAAAGRAQRLLHDQAGEAATVPSSPTEWMAAFEQAARGSRLQHQHQHQRQRPSSHAGQQAAAGAPPSGAAPVVFFAGSGAGVARRPHNRHQRQLHRDQQRQQQQQQQVEAAQAAGRPTGAAGAPASAAAAAAAAPERPRKQCANCGATAGGGVKLKKCGGCRTVRYCSPECQAAQWAQHKHVCAPVQ